MEEFIAKRQETLAKLQVLRLRFGNKPNAVEDMKAEHNIDILTLCNPSSAAFLEKYEIKDKVKEDIVNQLDSQAAWRNWNIFSVFIGYHLVKSLLKQVGYFPKFIYFTRFWSFPILGYSVYWNVQKTLGQYKQLEV